MITCTTCGEDTDPLAIFPGDICLECYRQTPDARRPLTADDVTQMWGGQR